MTKEKKRALWFGRFITQVFSGSPAELRPGDVVLTRRRQIRRNNKPKLRDFAYEVVTCHHTKYESTDAGPYHESPDEITMVVRYFDGSTGRREWKGLGTATDVPRLFTLCPPAADRG